MGDAAGLRRCAGSCPRVPIETVSGDSLGDMAGISPLALAERRCVPLRTAQWVAAFAQWQMAICTSAGHQARTG